MAWWEHTFNVGAILTAQQMNNVHNNFTELAQGTDASAPHIGPLALNSYNAGDLIITGRFQTRPIDSTSLPRIVYTVDRPGSLRTFLYLQPGDDGSINARIFVNSAAVGALRTKTAAAEVYIEDVSVASGDLLQVWVWDGSTSPGNFDIALGAAKDSAVGRPCEIYSYWLLGV